MFLNYFLLKSGGSVKMLGQILQERGGAQMVLPEPMAGKTAMLKWPELQQFGYLNALYSILGFFSSQSAF